MAGPSGIKVEDCYLKKVLEEIYGSCQGRWSLFASLDFSFGSAN
jgi:hypothetical protein